MPTAVLQLLRAATARLASLAGLAVALGCGWFATMELFLRHPGYGWRFLVAAAIAAEGTLTIAVLEDLLTMPALRWPLTAAAAATGFLGWWVIAEDVSRPGLPAGPHFEGYLLIIGLTLIAYSALTIGAMLTTERPHWATRSSGTSRV
jgi:hypothetical protein